MTRLFAAEPWTRIFQVAAAAFANASIASLSLYIKTTSVSSFLDPRSWMIAAIWGITFLGGLILDPTDENDKTGFWKNLANGAWAKVVVFVLSVTNTVISLTIAQFANLAWTDPRLWAIGGVAFFTFVAGGVKPPFK